MGKWQMALAESHNYSIRMVNGAELKDGAWRFNLSFFFGSLEIEVVVDGGSDYGSVFGEVSYIRMHGYLEKDSMLGGDSFVM